MREAKSIYLFGDFRLDTAEGFLFRGGKHVHLTLKEFAVLRVLVENAGHLVEKDDLLKMCWPDTAVEEANIAENVSVIRRALGETGKRQEYIETVYRRGYRFRANVSVEDQCYRNEEASLFAVASFQTNILDPNQTCVLKDLLRQDKAEPDHAHHCCMRGHYYLQKYTAAGLNRSIAYFHHAIESDPDCALAYTGLANCYYRLANLSLDPETAIPHARAAVRKALSLDGKLAEAHALLALISVFFDHDWPAAKHEFTKAMELAPSSATPYKFYGWALGMSQCFDEAVAHMYRALELEPLSSNIRTGLGIVQYLARRYEAAISEAQLALDLEPDFFPAYVVLAAAHLQQNRIIEAIKELDLGHAYGISGNHGQAMEILATLEQQAAGSYVSPYSLALIHVSLGKNEDALRYLELTSNSRNEMRGFVGSPQFDRLRSAERFMTLLHSNRMKMNPTPLVSRAGQTEK
jgi:DNA-binding winged helix-turn-helix (wHTH) protein